MYDAIVVICGVIVMLSVWAAINLILTYVVIFAVDGIWNYHLPFWPTFASLVLFSILFRRAK